MIPYDKLILLGIMTWQEYRILKQQKFMKLQADVITERNETVNYLLHIVNKNGIQLDEFDLIAMPTVKIVPRDQNTD